MHGGDGVGDRRLLIEGQRVDQSGSAASPCLQTGTRHMLPGAAVQDHIGGRRDALTCAMHSSSRDIIRTIADHHVHGADAQVTVSSMLLIVMHSGCASELTANHGIPHLPTVARCGIVAVQSTAARAELEIDAQDRPGGRQHEGRRVDMLLRL